MHSPGKWLSALLCFSCLGFFPSPAQTEPLSHFAEPSRTGQKASVASTGPLITDTTIPQSTGTANLQVTSLLALRTADFNANWRRVSAGGDFYSLALQAQLTYGLAPRTEIFVVVQYVHNWAIDVNRPGGERSADFGGLGDSNLTLKYLLLEEKSAAPAMAGVFGVSLPTGHHRALNPAKLGTDRLGSGSYAFTLGLNFFKSFRPALLYANLYYTMPTDATRGGVRLRPRDFVTANLAAEFPLSRRIILLLEITSTWDTGRLIGPKADQPSTALVSLLPGLEFIAPGAWQCAGGVLIDVIGKNTGADITPMLAIFYNF